MNAAARQPMLEWAEMVRADALAIGTTHTETVVAGNLETGDVITTLGTVVFPFPFTITLVQRHDRYGKVSLRAAHGWFATVNTTDETTRVLLDGAR